MTYCHFINRLREYGIFPVLNESAQDIQAVAKSFGLYEQKLSIYYALYRAYLAVQADKDFYTYNDQILFALAILKGYPNLAKKYQRRFEHIIVDEYQDLTKAQVQLLELLSQEHHHLMLFGNEQQDIRPDKISSSLSLLHDSQCHYLTTNFRCVQEILTLAHAVLGDKSPPLQQAARGSLHEQPEIIYVESPPSSSQSKQPDEKDVPLLKAMIDAALDRMKTLPDRDRECVGFIVAKSDFLDKVKPYIENEKKDYLENNHLNFSLMSNNYDYQSPHMKRMLTYFRLICNNMQEQDCKYLLQHRLTPPFPHQHIQLLKALAQSKLNDQSLCDYYDDPEQIDILQKHLLILNRFKPDDNARKLWNEICELSNDPVELQEEQQKEDKLIKSLQLEQRKVWEVLDYVSSHISFLPPTSSHNLVLTTIDYAKSQEFTTIFLIGADQLQSKEQWSRNRWYVAVTRARNRFFCLVDKNADPKHPILSAIQPYCVERNWPEQQGKLYALHEYS